MERCWPRATSPVSIKLWNAVNGKAIASLEGHTALVFSVSFSRDGKTLTSASKDGTARLWQVPMVEGRKGRASEPLRSEVHLVRSSTRMVQFVRLMVRKAIRVEVAVSDAVASQSAPPLRVADAQAVVLQHVRPLTPEPMALSIGRARTRAGRRRGQRSRHAAATTNP